MSRNKKQSVKRAGEIATNDAPRRVLNVGCGSSDISAGFPDLQVVRMDADRSVQPDVVHDITRPMPQAHRGIYEVVYASHVLEHVSWKKVEQVLDYLVSAVRPGGELWVIVPSLEWVARELMKDQPSLAVLGALFGSQDAKGQFHQSGYTMMWLRQLMGRHGLVVRKAFGSFFGIEVNGEEVAVGQNVVIGMKQHLWDECNDWGETQQEK